MVPQKSERDGDAAMELTISEMLLTLARFGLLLLIINGVVVVVAAVGCWIADAIVEILEHLLQGWLGDVVFCGIMLWIAIHTISGLFNPQWWELFNFFKMRCEQCS